MERYAKYKPTGAKWLESIPEEWEFLYPKKLFALRKDRAMPGDKQLTSSQKYGIILQEEFMQRENQRVVAVLKGEDILKHVETGDFVISMRSFQGGIEYSGVSGKISSAYVMLYPIDNRVYPPYFKHLVKSAQYIRALQATTNLVRDGQALRFANFIQVYLPLPPHDEQMAIADYLDGKLDHIDKAIEGIERTVELLQEYRRSVISEAVTHGLDPNVPMKDSGVEWIGEIPEHWTICPLKYVTNSYKAGPFGSALITSALLKEGECLVYCPEHISKQEYDLPGNLYLPVERLEEMAQFIVSPGDVLFPIVGSLGKAFYISKTAPAGIINQRLAKFRLDLSNVDPNYFMWLFGKSSFYEPYIEKEQRGSFIVNLTKQIVSQMPVTLPPLDEQRRIDSYLNAKIAEIDELVVNKQKQVELLKEYRRSLISEAVTGKFKVPGLE